MRKPVRSSTAGDKPDGSGGTTIATWNEVPQERAQSFGFLNINKPGGITSFDVIYKLRKILGVKKIGHSGTLDPLATGVLPIAVGNAARLIEFLEDDKKYVATLKFGETSTTYDDEGEKTFVAEPDFSLEELEAVLQDFTGKIKQVPPIYSAIKIGGKKLYELAREGKEVEVAPREVEIYDVKILEFTPQNTLTAVPVTGAKIKVHCSKGTYIRSLAHDIGQKLGCGAYLTALERTKAGAFEISSAITIEEAAPDKLIAPAKVLPFPQYELNETEYQKVKCGNAFTPQKLLTQGKALLVCNNALIAIASSEGGTVKPLKVMVK